MSTLGLERLAGRFWDKVDTSGDCWEWTAYRDGRGYGRINVARVPALAHRLSYELSVGPIPDGMYVCHRCDNPPCVNPEHMRDMFAKGRNAAPPRFHGEAHPSAVVSDRIIRAARESYAAGRERQHEIAERLGVAQTTVSAWVTGRIRPEAGGPIQAKRRRATRAEMAARRAA